MFKRNIFGQEVLDVLTDGFIIEEYKDDFPFPSVLVNGKSIQNRYIHIVVGIDIEQKRLFVITVYEPDPLIWKDNYSRRIP